MDFKCVKEICCHQTPEGLKEAGLVLTLKMLILDSHGWNGPQLNEVEFRTSTKAAGPCTLCEAMACPFLSSFVSVSHALGGRDVIGVMSLLCSQRSWTQVRSCL